MCLQLTLERRRGRINFEGLWMTDIIVLLHGWVHGKDRGERSEGRGGSEGQIQSGSCVLSVKVSVCMFSTGLLLD